MEEKKEIRVDIPFNFEWEDDISIQKLREDLVELEKRGAKNVSIRSSVDYDSSSLNIDAFVDRIETDEEFQKRIFEEKTKQDEIKRRDLCLLNDLKRKYNQ